MTAKMPLPDRTPRAGGAPTALDGLRVVDFTRIVAGPACTQTLADFGAEVIKIENPEGGDDTRAYEHAEIGGESAAYLSLNRNKRGIVLDLTVAEAREVARALIARADVVVENFSATVMEKFGLDYPSVVSSNPRLVYCSISAYGRKGPFASRPGFDPITQAESGFMSLNGFPDGPAVRTGPPIVDMATGMSACNAILMALLARERLGRGQHVEVALFDIAMSMTGFYGMAYLINGTNPGRFGNSPNGSPTVGVYEASDGPLYMACANDRLYRRLVTDVLERADLITDPRFANRRARTANKEKLRAIVAGVFAGDKLETLVADDLLPFERPFVIAHEWSHLAGIADEGEANFVGWLACLRGSPADQYSGWLFLFGELMRAVGRSDREALLAALDPGPRSDLSAIRDRLARHVNPRVSNAGWRVYDSYLKANRVEAGNASYFGVVRLVLTTEFQGDWHPRLKP